MMDEQMLKLIQEQMLFLKSTAYSQGRAFLEEISLLKEYMQQAREGPFSNPSLLWLHCEHLTIIQKKYKEYVLNDKETEDVEVEAMKH